MDTNINSSVDTLCKIYEDEVIINKVDGEDDSICDSCPYMCRCADCPYDAM